MRDRSFPTSRLRRMWLMAVLAALLLVLVACEGDEPAEEAEHGPVPQTGGTVESSDVQNDPTIVSPPILHEPLLRCGRAVRVSGFAPGATLRILEGGTDVIGTTTGFDPEGQMVGLDVALENDWLVTVVQEIDGTTSDPSNEVEVRDHTEEYPSGLPRPVLDVLPLYRCGIATLAGNLPEGGEVRVFSDARSDPIGRASGVWSSHSIGINPPFDEGDDITALSSICEAESDPSAPPRTVQPAPAALPAPELPEIYEDGSLIVVGNLVNGARVTIRDQATSTRVAGGGAPASRVRFRASPPVSSGQVLEVEETLCDADVTTTVTVKDCSELPPPTLIGPRPGDTKVYLTDVVAGSRVLIYSGGDEIGDGGGSVLRLTRPVEEGEVLTVVQRVGDCQSSSGYTVTVGTGLDDPGDPGQCQVERFEYGEEEPLTTDVSDFFESPVSSVTVPMDAVPLRGIVHHPVRSGRFPLVVIVHGNTIDPANAGYDGYDYLLEHLASHCIIGVSIDEHFLNGRVSGEMDARGLVMLRHLQLLRSWDRDPAHPLYGNIDHGTVMVAGHSRGGEAAVVAELFNRRLHDPANPDFDFGFGVRSIYAIAPVDGQIEGDRSAPLGGLPLNDVVVDTAAYFVIHGSHDGDVAAFDGHDTYDRAFPVAAGAGQVKALRFVHGANHKQFNTYWNTLAPDHPPTAAGADVQQLNKLNLTTYAFVTLRGWLPYRAFLKREVTFASMPAGMTVVRQYQDPDRTFVNHYEEDDNLATGSLIGVTNSTVGSITDYADIDFDAPGPPHWLWQQTDGLLLGWSAADAVLKVELDADHQSLIEDYPVLSFRIGQVYDASGTVNPAGVDKDLTLRIVSGGGPGPEVRIGDYVRLVSPVHVTGTWTELAPPLGLGHPATKTVMSTVRIPWDHLLPSGERDLGEAWEIHFEWDQHSTGLVVVDEIQASH